MLDSHDDEHYPHTRMRVVKMAIENCIMAKKLVRQTRPDWDHQDQMRRSSRSVYSNASEAERAIYRKVKIKALNTAVTENNEFASQVLELTEFGPHPLHDRINHVGRMLSNWIKNARPGSGDEK